jgi:hypothetical protein
MLQLQKSRIRASDPVMVAVSTVAALSFSCLTFGQTTGSGATVLQNGATLSPQNLSGVRYADQFTGSDLGAQINAAVTSLGTGGGVIRIRAGAYTWSTPVTINPLLVSIQGDGAPLVSIACTASECLKLNEPTYSISQGGSISGFSMAGSGAASQVGVEAGGVIGEVFEDLALSGFSGSGAVALLFNNSASSNGWMERTTTRKLRFDSNSVGLEFEYNTLNGAAQSFGYSNLEVQCDTLSSGQTCIQVNGGQVYHSRVVIFGNVPTGGTLIGIAGTTNAQMWSNDYQIFAEGSGTGLNVGSGGVFNGYGSVDFGGMAVVNGNGPSYSARVRVNQGPTEVVNGDGGSFSNFLGTGNAATIYPVLVRDIGTPVAGFGFLEGSNISSAYAAVYSGAPNAFVVLGCPYNPTSMASCVSEARIDTGGNVHAAGAFYANGADYAESVRVTGPTARYEPGDVMVIDTDSESRFARSSSAYSTGVAGVYSTKPGVLGSSHAMDAPAAEEIPLAIHGMVPCKVSAENGPISPGDLLVSASIPGYAMKGTDRSKMLGAVIGKALGSLDHGKGVVQVLLTPQ